MSDEKPNHETSNYGWALWHLEQLQKPLHESVIAGHVGAAQARATLALIDSQESVQIGRPHERGSTWSGGRA